MISRVDVHARELDSRLYNRLNEEYEDTQLWVIVDFHCNDEQYHGPPPHLLPDGSLLKIPEGYGYAPFGWIRGWVWMQEKLKELMESARPDYIQFGYEPHIRNGWGFATKPEYHYNDMMGIFREALLETSKAYHPKGIVIPETPGSPIQRKAFNKVLELQKKGEFPNGIRVLYQQDMDVNYEEPPAEDENDMPSKDIIDLINIIEVNLNQIRKILS